MSGVGSLVVHVSMIKHKKEWVAIKKVKKLGQNGPKRSIKIVSNDTCQWVCAGVVADLGLYIGVEVCVLGMVDHAVDTICIQPSETGDTPCGGWIELPLYWLSHLLSFLR